MDELYRTVKKLFADCVLTEELIVAPDCSGVYFFSVDKDSVLESVKSLLGPLGLSWKSVVVCCVSEEFPCVSEFRPGSDKIVYCINPSDLARFVLESTQKRIRLFSSLVVQDILDCFIEREQQRSELDEQLLATGITEEELKRLKDSKACLLTDLESLGFTPEEATKIDAVLKKYYGSFDDTPIFNSNENWTPREFVTLCYAAAGVFCGIALTIFLIADFLWPISVAFSLFSVFMVSRATRCERSKVTYLLFIMDFLVLVLCLPIREVVSWIQSIL